VRKGNAAAVPPNSSAVAFTTPTPKPKGKNNDN